MRFRALLVVVAAAIVTLSGCSKQGEPSLNPADSATATKSAVATWIAGERVIWRSWTPTPDLGMTREHAAIVGQLTAEAAEQLYRNNALHTATAEAERDRALHEHYADATFAAYGTEAARDRSSYEIERDADATRYARYAADYESYLADKRAEESSSGACDPSYPDFCIPPAPPDLDCSDIAARNFTVLPPDPHGFDADGDGYGCEWN